MLLQFRLGMLRFKICHEFLIVESRDDFPAYREVGSGAPKARRSSLSSKCLVVLKNLEASDFHKRRKIVVENIYVFIGYSLAIITEPNPTSSVEGAEKKER